MSKLSEEQISLQLKNLSGWKTKEDALTKTYKFPKFIDSISFINQVAELAEAGNHHPDMLIQYNKVTILLVTHDQGGITEKDFLLAEQIEAL